MTDIAAIYHDGETAIPKKVALRPDRVAERLLILDEGGRELAAWNFSDIRELRDHGRSRALVAHRPGHEARLVMVGAAVASDFRAMIPEIGKLHYDREKLHKALWWAGGAVASVLLLLFVIIPGLADQLARWIPPKSEVAFGNTVTNQFARLFARADGTGFCDSPAASAALEELGDRLAAGLDLPYPLRIRVMNSGMVNAFAVPGGQVVVFRGLIDEAANGEEVAGVLAHEIGHVAAHDPTRIALRSAGSAGLLGLFFGDFAGGTAVAVMSEQLMQASYAREAEAAADAFAHGALARAGLPAAPLAGFFERLRDRYGDANGLVAAFLSHPRLSDRIAAARAAATAKPGAPAFAPQAWESLRSICADTAAPDA